MALDNLDELRVFLQVVDQRSFSGAARTLGHTVNIVSRRVARLEERLGVRLLHRTTRTVSVTEEGRRFVHASRRVVEEAEAAEATLLGGVDQATGLVRVALPTAFVRFGFAAQLGRLLSENARLRLQVIVVDHPLDLVAAGVDVAVVDERASPSYLVRKLGRLSPVLAAAPAYVATNGQPQGPSELAAHECLRFRGQSSQSSWPLVDRRGQRVSAPVSGRLESNDSRLLHDALYAGLGIGFCAAAELREAAAARRLVRVLPEYSVEPMAIRAVLPARPGVRRPRRVEVLVDLLRASLSALA